jgi:hypothetical protein
MRSRQWTINKPQPHRIVIEYGGWFADYSLRILVDGIEIYRRPQRYLLDSLFGIGGFDGIEHRFELGGQPAIVRILHRFTHFEYELYVDGKLQ